VLHDMLPATIPPTWSGSAAIKGVCSATCEVDPTCSSFAYSQREGLCQTFSHPNLTKPLPTLTQDPLKRGFQMHYLGSFCPVNWDADYASQTCYLASVTTPMSRFNAWGVCEENHMSQLAMFQTPQQRDALYSILSAKYSSVNNYWLGYAQFDDLLWPRPV